MTLMDALLDRLEAADSLEERSHDLVLAALTDDVDSVLDGAGPPSEPDRSQGDEVAPRGAWLRSISVEGFRGIGRSVALPLTAGPGLHVICGRNGSGKSSFSEALELLLTDSCSRWDRRSKSWREGWQNLHVAGPTRIVCEVAIDGLPRSVAVEGEWESGSSPEDRRVDRVVGAEELSIRDDLGWSGQFETWSPFLPYNELGSLLEDGPARLHDTLASVLGLEMVAEAIGRLESRRKAALRRQPQPPADRDGRLGGRSVGRRPGGDEPRRASQPGSFLVSSARNAAGEPLSLPADRRPGAGDGPDEG